MVILLCGIPAIRGSLRIRDKSITLKRTEGSAGKFFGSAKNSLVPIPTVCLYVTSLVASSYGYDDGKNGPTRCALIGAARGDR